MMRHRGLEWVGLIAVFHIFGPNGRPNTWISVFSVQSLSWKNQSISIHRLPNLIQSQNYISEKRVSDQMPSAFGILGFCINQIL